MAENEYPSLDYVFFTASDNRKWLETQRGHIFNQHYSLRWFYFMVMLFPVGFFLAGLLWMLIFEGEERHFTFQNSFLLFTLPLLLLVAMYPIRQHWRLRQLEKHGKLIIGRVESFDNPLATGNLDGVYRDVIYGRIAILRYRFRTPTGEEVVGERRYNPGRWFFPTDPQAGERIAIIYASPTLHEPL